MCGCGCGCGCGGCVGVGVCLCVSVFHRSVVAANIMKDEPSLTWADIMEASDSVLERYGVSDLKIGRIRSLIKTKYSGRAYLF